MVVTCEKLSCKCEVEIGLCFGNEIGVSLNEGGGFTIRQAVGISSLDEGDSDGWDNEDRKEMRLDLRAP